MNDTLARTVDIVEFKPEFNAIHAQRTNSLLPWRIGFAGAARQGRYDVIDHRKIQGRITNSAKCRAQAIEGLPARAVVNKVTIDMKERAAIAQFTNDMPLPDLVDERRHHAYLRVRARRPHRVRLRTLRTTSATFSAVASVRSSAF